MGSKLIIVMWLAVDLYLLLASTVADAPWKYLLAVAIAVFLIWQAFRQVIREAALKREVNVFKTSR